MKVKLLALDIDGTLTNDQKIITPKTREALLRAQEEGVPVLLASARPEHGLYSTAQQLEMAEHHGLLMAYNGGRIVDAADGHTYSEIHMDMEKTRGLLRFLETMPQVTIILDDGKQFYVTDAHGYKVEYESHNNDMTCVVVDRLSDFLNFSPIKLLLAVDPSEIYAVQERIAAKLDPDLEVVRTAPFYLEIFPKAIDKGKGLRDICAVLGIRSDDVAAFGDSENDIPMLREAGWGIAMANAEQAVKDVADQVTLSNNEDGIAYAIEQWLT